MSLECEGTKIPIVGFSLSDLLPPTRTHVGQDKYGWDTCIFQGFSENSIGRNSLVCALVVDLECDRVCFVCVCVCHFYVYVGRFRM